MSSERFELGKKHLPGQGRDGPARKQGERKSERGHSESGQAQLRPAFESRSRGPRRAATDDTQLYGALDLGTNNCRLLIAVATERGPKVIDAFSRIVRLGEGLGHHGVLSEEAMDRTIEALRICANKLMWHRVKKMRLIATEACRFASNGADFIQRVKDEIGLELEIIDRETEAHLAAAGAEPLIDREARSVVVFDIGGGSTEVMWMEAEGSRFVVKEWTSLAAGVVTLSERMGGGRDVTPDHFLAMRQRVGDLLRPFIERVQNGKYGLQPPDHLLGTSGTVTTIAGVQMGLRTYDRGRVDGAWLKSEAVESVVGNILKMDYQERVRHGCIGRERADLVLAGCAILEEIRKSFPADRIRVADRGLREGILAHLIASDSKAGVAA